jgi:hypothetical protein
VKHSTPRLFAFTEILLIKHLHLNLTDSYLISLHYFISSKEYSIFLAGSTIYSNLVYVSLRLKACCYA